MIALNNRPHVRTNFRISICLFMMILIKIIHIAIRHMLFDTINAGKIPMLFIINCMIGFPSVPNPLFIITNVLYASQIINNERKSSKHPITVFMVFAE